MKSERSDEALTKWTSWLASQVRDLDAVLGGSEAAVLGPGGHRGLAEHASGNVRHLHIEELRLSDFFRLSWVEEVVAGCGS
jgi:hypothetical protein